MSSEEKTENPGSAPDTTSAGHRKRLRERFKRTSLDGFHDYEIVELLLTFAIPRRDVKPVAKEVMRRFGSLKAVFEAPADKLASISGIGEHASVLLSLVRGTADAYLKEEVAGKGVIRSPDDAAALLRHAAKDTTGEKLLAVYMNSRSEVLGMETLHSGALSALRLTPRVVIERAFSHNARSIIFCHDLAGGKDAPGDDKKLAASLEAAAAAIDIIIHDYIVLDEKKDFSARKKGWLKWR